MRGRLCQELTSSLVTLFSIELKERLPVAHSCAEVSPCNKESDRIELPLHNNNNNEYLIGVNVSEPHTGQMASPAIYDLLYVIL